MDIEKMGTDDSITSQERRQGETLKRDEEMKKDEERAVEISSVKEEEVSEAQKYSSKITIMFSAMALLADGYNAQVIGYLNAFFDSLYKEEFTSTMKTRLSNAYLIGNIVGMLLFGLVIDKFGRRFGIFMATLLLVLGVVITTASHGKDVNGMFWMMVVGRGVAGVGAGGEYPVCSTGATEATDEQEKTRNHRGFIVGMISDFAIDTGFVLSGVILIIIIYCYHQVESSGIWRVSFGLGIVLPLFVFYFRVKTTNSTQYKKHAIRKNVPYMLVLKRYWKPIVGSCLTWFLYDFVTYPFGLFSSTIVSQLNAENSNVKNIGFATLINVFLLPGCVIGSYLMDKIGRKNTMMAGFFCQAILGFVLGGALGPIQTVVPLFLVLYGIFQGFGEMGPGVTTFLISGESYPTPLRGHLFGLSAAVGKAGAAIGTEVFTPIQTAIGKGDDLKGQQGVFLIASGFALLGGLVAYFFVPNMSKRLESEDAAFKKYLQQNGYEHLDEMGLDEGANKAAKLLS